MGSSDDRVFPGLRFDPAPGRPADLAALNALVGNAIHEVTGVTRSLREADTESTSWTGVAADGYRARVAQMGGGATLLGVVLAGVHAALQLWSDSLTGFKKEGEGLERQAVEARAVVDRLKDDPRGDISYAVLTYMPEDQAKTAMNNYTAWKADKENAENALDAVIASAHALKDRHDAEARRAADSIEWAADPNTYAPKTDGSPDTSNPAADRLMQVGDFYSSLSALTGIPGLPETPATGLLAKAVPVATVVSSALSLDALIVHSLAAYTGADVPTRTLVLDALGIVPGFTAIKAVKDTEVVSKFLNETGKAVTYIGLSDLVFSGFQPIKPAVDSTVDTVRGVTDKIPGIRDIPGLGSKPETHFAMSPQWRKFIEENRQQPAAQPGTGTPK